METAKAKLTDLSIFTIVKFFLVLLTMVFFYYTRDILLIVFVAFVLAAALRPGVDSLMRRRFPRSLAILVFFLIFFAIVALIATFLLPILIDQVREIGGRLPAYYSQWKSASFFTSSTWQRLTGLVNVGENGEGMAEQLSVSGESVWNGLLNVFGGIFHFFVMLVLTFYLLIEEDAIKKFFRSILPDDTHNNLASISLKIQQNISAWVKGQVTLSFLMALLYFISLSILGVPYALAFAVLVFIGEFVPYIGPFLASLPAVILAFGVSPLLGLFTFVMIIIVQQIETHILIPKVMQRAVGINPVITIISMLVGARLAGAVGVILAIPVVTSIMVAVREIILIKKTQ
jgi:predicted PurR-regulated permease PerM